MTRFFKTETSFIVLVSALAGLGLGYSCATSKGPRVIDARTLAEKLDMSELTPSESKRLERAVNREVSPCGDDVTLAESLFNPENCPLAPSAGTFVVEQIKADFNEEEISQAYLMRYGSVKGLEIPLDGSPKKGSENPKVTFVVFTDFQCPHCAKAAERQDELLRLHPEEFALVHKNFPLTSIHPMSELAARAAFAAGIQDKFWEMHDMLFSTVGTELNRDRIDMIAEGLGLDMDRFAEDLTSTAATAAIESDKKLGESLGIHATPAIFINGRPVENGLAGVDERVKEELLRASLNNKK